MPKTIATTPSWYWPEGLKRAIGIPPFCINRLIQAKWSEKSSSDLAITDGTRTFYRDEFLKILTLINSTDILKQSDDGITGVVLRPDAESFMLFLSSIASHNNVQVIKNSDTLNYLSNLDAVLVSSFAEHNGTLDPNKLGYRVLSEKDLYAISQANSSIVEHDLSKRDPRSIKIYVDGKFGLARHSHKSVLSQSISFIKFFEPVNDSPWLIRGGIFPWLMINAAIGCLLYGVPILIGKSAEDAIVLCEKYQVSTVVSDLNVEQDDPLKRSKGDNRIRMILGTGSSVQTDVRRNIANNSKAEVLNVFGCGETGPMLGSHPSWYLQEATGIPFPNMNLIPIDPYTADPIDTLWEFLDEAGILAWSPSVADPVGEQYIGNKLITGYHATADPNGMLYILDDGL
jgi:hypothetical protein